MMTETELAACYAHITEWIALWRRSYREALADHAWSAAHQALGLVVRLTNQRAALLDVQPAPASPATSGIRDARPY